MEIVRADPVLRRRAFVILAALAIVLAVVSLFYGDPVQAWFDHIEAVRRTDPSGAEVLVQNTTLVLLTLLWIVGASALALGTWYGRTFWKAERWPPVGAKLIHDTPVIYGRLSSGASQLKRWTS